MIKEKERFKSYLKEHKSSVSLILEKIEGLNSNEITLEEKALLRTIYDGFLDEENLIEDDSELE